jgi:hypothetical protein
MNEKILFAMVLSIFLVAANAGSASGQNSDSSTSRSELASYMATSKVNWEALRKYDVMFRTDVFRDEAISPGYIETTFERLIFDWEQERCLYVKRGDRETLSGKTIEKVAIGCVVKDGVVRAFRAPGRATAPISFKLIKEVLDERRVPDLRLTMFLRRRLPENGVWIDDRVSAYDIFPKQAETVKRLPAAENHVGYKLQFSNGVGYAWSFSLDNLMPVDGRWSTSPVDDPDAEKLLCKESYKWEEIGGLLLPVAIVSEYHELEFPRDIQLNLETFAEHAIQATTEYDTRFAWISVNEEIEDKMFDFATMDSPSEFLSLTDPLSQGVPLLSDGNESKRKKVD